MEKIVKLRPQYNEIVPSKLENGILYISKRYSMAVHLCACGCGGKTITPLGKDRWILTETHEGVSLKPSIGNWAGESPYHAHYYITNNKIIWC